MTDLERANLERPRINSNTTSNKLERITQNMFFFTIIEQTKHKKPTNYLAKQKTLHNKNLQYDEINFKNT